jgi:hypothetical protein
MVAAEWLRHRGFGNEYSCRQSWTTRYGHKNREQTCRKLIPQASWCAPEKHSELLFDSPPGYSKKYRSVYYFVKPVQGMQCRGWIKETRLLETGSSLIGENSVADDLRRELSI